MANPARSEDLRRILAKRIEARREEIERATATHVYAISDPSETSDPEYTEGLPATITAALNYAVVALKHSEDNSPPIPNTVLSQARLAARNQVRLTTVLRRYFAGYMLLEDFLFSEIEALEQLSGGGPQRVLRSLATLFDRVIAAVSDEYSREAAGRPEGLEQRRTERVESLLRGESVDTSDLAYDFDGWHLGAIATGPCGEWMLREVLEPIGGRVMLARRSGEVVWAWAGSRHKPNPSVLRLPLTLADSSSTPMIAFGEPAKGLAGWRLTHRQARAGLPVALQRGEGVVRYGDVALLASMLQDDLLLESLRNLYLAPLEASRGGGAATFETLRAYFNSARSVSSAAATLSVSRKTVGSRLRAIEDRLGKSIDSCALELEVAVRLRELCGSPAEVR